jgi:hypothetical protein
VTVINSANINQANNRLSSCLAFYLKMPFLKEGEIRRRKKCSEHLKELDRNVGETELDQTDADQTDANPGTDYKDIAFNFLRNRLFMTSMQLPRKMSRSLL